MKRVFSASFLLLVLVLLLGGAQAYTTYTVGGDYGWGIPSTSNGNINYTAWASKSKFSLGDSLAFHYSQEHSVVQTNNLTTYQSCDSTADDDTLQIWSSINSTDATVLLTTTGDNYFFCSAYDGDHCLHSGMKFAIHVEHGQGLPIAPSLPPEAGDDDVVGNFPSFELPPPPPGPPGEDSATPGEDSTTPGEDSSVPSAAPPLLTLHCWSLAIVLLLFSRAFES